MKIFCLYLRLMYLISFISLPFALDSDALAETRIGCNSPGDVRLKVNFFGDYFLDPNTWVDADSIADVRDMISEADHTVVNLEGTLSGGQKRAYPDAQFALRMENKAIDFLAFNKIFNVTRANNHATDYGYIGAKATSDYLDYRGISWTGVGSNLQEASKPIVFTKQAKEGKLSVALLAFSNTFPLESWATASSAGINPATEESIVQSVKAAQYKADFVVVAFHWGTELSPVAHEGQTRLAKLAIDAGADLIIGHHAHVAQTIAFHKGTLIAYGLGNFLFSGKITGALQLGQQTVFCKNAEIKVLHSHFVPLELQYSEKTLRVRSRSFGSFLKSLVNYNSEGINSFGGLDVSFFLVKEKKWLRGEKELSSRNVSDWNATKAFAEAKK